MLAALDDERLVDGREEVFCEVGREPDDVVEVALGVLGVEAAEEVAGRSC